MDLRYAMIFAILVFIPLSAAVSFDGTVFGKSSISATAVPGMHDMLGSAMSFVQCKNTFMTGVMDSIISADPSSGASLEPQISALNQNENKLQGDVSSADAQSFRSDVFGTYDPSVKSSRDSVLNWRAGTKNMSRQTRLSLASNYTQLLQSYGTCAQGALKNYADAKVSSYSDELSYAQSTADNLSKKGVSVDAMDSLITDANSQIVQPLQSAVDSATDAKGYLSALSQYCLYDGCRNGTNFHFSAKFETAKIDAIYQAVDASPKAANYTTQLNTAQSDISAAQSDISAMGTTQGTTALYSDIASKLKDAGEQIKEVLAGMRSGR